MKTISIPMLIILITSVVPANSEDNKKETSTYTSNVVSTQTATTRDGRTVILKPDGTWEYAKGSHSDDATTSGEQQNGTLSFDTGIVLQSGDVKPIARGTFYLLNDDLENVFKSADVEPFEGSVLAKFVVEYNLRELDQRKGDIPKFDTMLQFIKPHIVATTTTDFSGKGQFTFAPGVYYLMHISKIFKNVILWNLKVEIKAGQNSQVTLDQNNTAVK